jgi:phospholipase/lecithinase/hemolysin
VITLSQQLEYFKEYKERLKLAKGDAVADEIISEALYVFSIGTNDFTVNYFFMPLRAAEYTPEEYISYLVGLAEAAVRDVHELGARKIMFGGIPPFGCVPAMRTMNHDAPGECNEEYNRVALMYNAEIRAAMGRLGGEFGGGARVVYADVYDMPYDIIANPSAYGFEEVAQGCCGTGAIETSVLCGMDAAFTCQDADKYVFFDSVHPSQRTYKILADDLIRNSLQVFM